MAAKVKGRISCEGAPSATNYGNGCRCSDCRSAWAEYSAGNALKNRKKKPSGKRDSPFVMDDAFTREQIIKARKAKK
tara:strand:- start:362 stop:592 length:231 start_codon:yes stop_codon:yes gene_type:complete